MQTFSQNSRILSKQAQDSCMQVCFTEEGLHFLQALIVLQPSLNETNSFISNLSRLANAKLQWWCTSDALGKRRTMNRVEGGELRSRTGDNLRRPFYPPCPPLTLSLSLCLSFFPSIQTPKAPPEGNTFQLNYPAGTKDPSLRKKSGREKEKEFQSC